LDANIVIFFLRWSF